MNRRNFLLAAGGGLGMAIRGRGAEPKNAILEMRRLQMRNTPDGMAQHTTDFLSKSYIPALQRAGAGPIGAFGSVIAPESPFLLLITSYPSLAAFEISGQKIRADKEYVAAREAFHSANSVPYVRMESSLLRCFSSIPNLEVPATDGKRAPRIFELRRYESNNLSTLRKKIRMFDEGEIGVFRRLNMLPVFFGETVVGSNMPNLTYMLAFDDLSARDKAWSAFGGDAEWKRLRSQPGMADSEIVSNISNSILRPLPFSAIR
jgi:hypothetical protein